MILRDGNDTWFRNAEVRLLRELTVNGKLANHRWLKARARWQHSSHRDGVEVPIDRKAEFLAASVTVVQVYRLWSGVLVTNSRDAN